LEVNIWCSPTEGFVKHAKLGEVLEIFTIHIRELLNSADKWKMSVIVCTWMAAHYTLQFLPVIIPVLLVL
jgi:hypothetical protein